MTERYGLNAEESEMARLQIAEWVDTDMAAAATADPERLDHADWIASCTLGHLRHVFEGQETLFKAEIRHAVTKMAFMFAGKDEILAADDITPLVHKLYDQTDQDMNATVRTLDEQINDMYAAYASITKETMGHAWEYMLPAQRLWTTIGVMENSRATDQ